MTRMPREPPRAASALVRRVASSASFIPVVWGTPAACTVSNPDGLARYAASIPDAGMRLYLESAVQTMRLAEAEDLKFELEVTDDIRKITGQPATTIAMWAKDNLPGQA